MVIGFGEIFSVLNCVLITIFLYYNALDDLLEALVELEKVTSCFRGGACCEHQFEN